MTRNVTARFLEGRTHNNLHEGHAGYPRAAGWRKHSAGRRFISISRLIGRIKKIKSLYSYGIDMN